MEEALFKAAEMGNRRFLQQIQDPKILTKQNQQGDTACHVALREGQLEFVSFMAYIHPPILCQPNADGDTVLHCALKMEQLKCFSKCIRHLRSYFQEYIKKDFSPDNARDFPVEVSHCVDALRNAEGKSLVYVAAENGYDEAVRTLMKLPLLRRTDGPNGSTAVHVAVRKRYHDITQLLLEYKPDIVLCQDADGNTALHLVVMQNDHRMLELLVRGSCGQQLVKILNNDGHSPFHLAATMNYLEIFQLLLKLCPECYLANTTCNQNVLHLAMQEKAAEIVEFIVKDKKMAEYMINQQDNDGNTPLHIAASDGNKKMLDTLLASPVLVQTLKNKEGLTFLDISKSKIGEEALFQAAQTGDAGYLIQNQDPVILSKLNPQGDTACHVAFQEGHLQFISLMAKTHPPILCQPNAEGDTVLHHALKMGHHELFSECLTRLRMHFHEYINKDFFPGNIRYFPVEVFNCVRALRNAEGKSLVYMAAENGYIEAVRSLMELPLLRRTDGPNGSTALHIAVREKNYDITQLLLQFKPDIILCQDGDGNTALHLAVLQNDCRMVELLKGSCGQQLVRILNKDGHSPFHLAATMNYLEIFHLLLPLFPKAITILMESPLLSRTDGPNGSTVLHVRVRERNYDITQLLVQCKPDIILCQDGDGNTALHLAVMQNDHRMVELLVKGSRGQQLVKILNNDGHLPFHLAATMNNLEIFRLLLPLSPEAITILMESPSLSKTDAPNGSTALHVAVRERNYDLTQLLLQYKPDIILCQDGDGNTALHLAVMQNDCRMVEHLVTVRCRRRFVKILNNDGHSPFHLAATMNYLEIFRLLLPLFPEAITILMESPLLSRTDGPEGSTPLHVAVREKNYDVMQLLLEYKPDIILYQDGDGKTALHLAVMLNDLKMVELLLKETCRLELMYVLNKDGFYPLHLAASMNHLETFQLLLRVCPECYLANTTRNQNLLHLAVREKAAEIVRVIVKDKKMAEHMINQQDDDGNTPLHIAASDGNKKMLDTLLASPVLVQTLENKEGLTFLDISKRLETRKRRPIRLPFWLAMIIPPNRLEEIEWFEAAKKGDTEFLSQHERSRFLTRQNAQGDTACHMALREGHRQFVSLLARIHPPVLCEPDAEGDTVLHYALKMGQVELFSECLTQLQKHFHEHIDKDFHGNSDRFPEKVWKHVQALRNAEGKSLVYMAAENGYVEAMRALMKLPLLRCADGPNQSTALHVSVCKRNYDITQVLLDYKPDIILCQDRDGNTAVHLAVEQNDHQMVELLVKGSCGRKSLKILNKNGHSPFHLAATRTDLKIFRFLLPLYPEAIMILVESPSSSRTDGPDRSTALHVAVRQRNYDVVQLLLEYKPDIVLCQDGDGNTALHLAVIQSDHRMVELLVKESRGGQLVKILNNNGHSPLHLAATLNCLEIFRRLLSLLPEAITILMESPSSSRADVPSTALHDAVREGNYDITKVLVEYKPEIILCQDGDGNTVLHLAVMQNDKRMVELLLKESCGCQSVNILNKNGHSPFHLAATMNYVEIFQLILQLCPECYLANTPHDQNVLHLIAQTKTLEIAEFLVKDEKMAECMINQQDSDGNTPLHIAASEGNKKMLNTLLSSPVRVQPLKNKKGLTFLDISKALEARKRREKQIKVLTATESFHSSLLVMASLITTVTFTASFTMPGGYKSENGDDQGMATLAGRAAFKVFLVADAVSTCGSVIAMAMLVLFSVITNKQKKFWTLTVAIGSIVLSVIFMLVAFAFGVWVVIGSECKWLAILTAVVASSCAPLVLALAYGLIEIPSESEDEAADVGTLVKMFEQLVAHLK